MDSLDSPDDVHDQELDTANLVDIGNQAVWTATSSRPGNGIECVRDANPETLWQSDGTLPHNIDVAFSKRVRIERIMLYCDYSLDESYTPSQIAIHAGSSYHDLQHVFTAELAQPQGWTQLMMTDASAGGTLNCFLLRLSILANHENGRDCHIRGIRIFARRQKELRTELDSTLEAVLR